MASTRSILSDAAVCLLIGAVASVALAMLAPRYLPNKQTPGYARGLNTRETSWVTDCWSVHPRKPYASGAEAIRFVRSVQFVPDKDGKTILHEQLANGIPFHAGGTCELVDAGFPFRCISGWRYWFSSIDLIFAQPRPAPPRDAEQGFIELPALKPGDGPSRRWITYYPLWLGLAGNSIVWGSVAWLGLFGMAALRRTLRGRRGQCAHCGYNLAGLAVGAVCPECGCPRTSLSP